MAVGSENKVSIEMRAKFMKEGVGDLLQEVFVPKRDVMVIRRGVKKTEETRLLPGYVFVNMVNCQESVSLIRNLPRVIGFLGKDLSSPQEVSEKEIQNLMNQEEEISKVSHSMVSFDPGEVVKVCDGLFSSMQGVVEEVNEDKSRLKVSINILGRTTPVDLDFSQVEKVC